MIAMAARQLILMIMFIFGMKGQAQNEPALSLIGSYQFYERKAVSLGIGTTRKVNPFELGFDQYIKAFLRGSIFFSDQGRENIYGARSTIYWTSEHVGIGMDARFIFQADRQRWDLGPAIQIGYQTISVEYTANFQLGENSFHEGPDRSPIPFKKVEHNINLSLTIPIIKKKE